MQPRTRVTGRWKLELSSRWRPRARRAVVLLALCALVVLGAGRAVAGAVGRRATAAGEALSVLARQGDGTRAIRLNGSRFVVRTETFAGSLAQVLAAAHARCTERSVTSAWPESTRTGRLARGASFVAQTFAPDGVLDGVLDVQSDGQGVVGCFEASEGRPPFADLTELGRALSAAAEDGDLSALGRFRYLYAREESRGRTAQLELTSDGALDVAGMFPKQGDAPGVDDAELPRPSGARRVLSVAYEAGPDARRASLTGYESPRAASELRSAYAAELRARGLTPSELPAAAAPREGQARDLVGPLVVRTRTRTVVVSFSEPRASQGSWVLLLPLP